MTVTANHPAPAKRKPAPAKPTANHPAKAKHKPASKASAKTVHRKPAKHKAKPTPPPYENHRQGRLTGGRYVHIFAVTRPLKVTVLLAEAGAHITGGFGKWEEIAVPRDVPLTEWVGRQLWTMDVEILLDGWQHQRSIERQIHTIEQMALRGDGSHNITPPPIRIIGAVPHSGLTWVIVGIDFADTLRHPRTGARLRQGMTLHLMEYEVERKIAALLPPPRKHKVVKGDNLKKLATRYLGKSARWKEIAKLNKGLRGWRLPKHWVGKTILIPAH